MRVNCVLLNVPRENSVSVSAGLLFEPGGRLCRVVPQACSPATGVPGFAALQMFAPGVGEIGEPGAVVRGCADVATQASSSMTSESGSALVRLFMLFALIDR